MGKSLEYQQAQRPLAMLATLKTFNRFRMEVILHKDSTQVVQSKDLKVGQEENRVLY